MEEYIEQLRKKLEEQEKKLEEKEKKLEERLEEKEKKLEEKEKKLEEKEKKIEEKEKKLQEKDNDLWMVKCLIKNAMNIKGVRQRAYKLCDAYLGYYFLDEHGERNSFIYNGFDLNIKVIFKKEENALHFESFIRQEQNTHLSPMNSLEVINIVERFENSSKFDLIRIYFHDYVALESESPQDGITQISHSTISVYSQFDDEFMYQRIEADWVFGSSGRAEKCHLIPSAHCKNFSSYSKYDNDPNNRLALSRDLHGYYDCLSSSIPLFNLKVVEIDPTATINGRTKVTIEVSVLKAQDKRTIFNRLKDGSFKVENNDLAMATTVHVVSPLIFKKCLDWKYNEIRKKWKEHLEMESAVP